MKQEKLLSILGWVATVTAMAMYVSYIPQISSNLSGHKGDWLQPMVAGINCTLWVGYGFIHKKKGDFLQPFVAGINCTLWVLYGFLGEKRDWPIIIANIPGVIFGFFAFATAL